MRAPAQRARIDPFVVMEVVAEAARLDATTGGDVLHLEVGQPSTGAPAAAVAAARAALEGGDALGYTPAAGLAELRAAIAARYGVAHDIEVAPERIVVTVGASGAAVLAMLAAFDPGDAVAVTVPGYPCYRQMLAAFGVRPVEVRIGPSDRFVPTPDHLERARTAAGGRLAGVVLASPSNPTGTVLSPTELAAVAAWCEANDAWLLSDEIYHGITFAGPAASAAGRDGAVVLGSFSKFFSMTGWRLGWAVVPEALAVAVDRLQQTLFLCAPTLAQHAALGALGDDAAAELAGHVVRYRRNRDRLVAALAGWGIDTVAPSDGAFYVYAETTRWAADSRELCRGWLTDLRVAATPGVDFDPTEGHRWVRFSVSGEERTVDAAVDRLDAWQAGAGRTGP